MVRNKFLDKSSGVMAGPLNMSNNKITHLATATANGNAVDYEFFNKYTPQGTRLNANNNRAFFSTLQYYRISGVVDLAIGKRYQILGG